MPVDFYYLSFLTFLPLLICELRKRDLKVICTWTMPFFNTLVSDPLMCYKKVQNPQNFFFFFVKGYTKFSLSSPTPTLPSLLIHFHCTFVINFFFFYFLSLSIHSCISNSTYLPLPSLTPPSHHNQSHVRTEIYLFYFSRIIFM